MKWLEVSLTLEAELVEPVADLLARHSPGGVAIEIAPKSAFVEERQATGPAIVRAYLPFDDLLGQRKRSLEEGLWHLGRIRPIPAPVYTTVQEADWADAWKAHYRPIPVGRRLLILPPWLKPPPSERLAVFINPGMAFGTGTHPTTQLVLQALEDYLKPGQVVADLGCGSGLLSIAAARLGASQVLALDNDPQAVETAISNVEFNGVGHLVRVVAGSLEELLKWGPRASYGIDLLMGNILASVLTEMLHLGLAEAVQPEGILILSGILDHQADSIVAVGEQQGLSYVETRCDADWRALVFKRRPPPDSGGGKAGNR